MSNANTESDKEAADELVASAMRIAAKLNKNEAAFKREPTGCNRCDSPGGKVTYANQACLPLNGRVVCVDWCIHQIVAALNAGGIRTVACCCGHGEQDGRIDLEDGRVFLIGRGRP